MRKPESGVNEWVDQLLQETSSADKNLDLDYQVYGKAEASLGG